MHIGMFAFSLTQPLPTKACCFAGARLAGRHPSSYQLGIALRGSRQFQHAGRQPACGRGLQAAGAPLCIQLLDCR